MKKNLGYNFVWSFIGVCKETVVLRKYWGCFITRGWKIRRGETLHYFSLNITRVT